MVDRITLTKTTYMEVDGQPQIVLSGSVIDVPSSTAFEKTAVVEKNTGTLNLPKQNRPHAVRRGF